jgi:ribosomal protein S18 acetylase RimI-like enzyme
LSTTTQSWQVRPFQMGDYEAIYALWRDAGEGVSLRPSDQREEIAKKLDRDPDLFLVAEAEGQVVGVVLGAWDGRRGWLHHLAVHTAHRQQGIATALIRAVEAGLRARGCLKVNLLVSRTNQAAKCLYVSLGYQEMSAFVPMGKEL